MTPDAVARLYTAVDRQTPSRVLLGLTADDASSTAGGGGGSSGSGGGGGGGRRSSAADVGASPQRVGMAVFSVQNSVCITRGSPNAAFQRPAFAQRLDYAVTRSWGSRGCVLVQVYGVAVPV